MKKINSRPCCVAAVLCLLVSLLALTGCVSGTYGKLKTNETLMGQYKDKTLPGDYQYYYCGRSGLPYAVVGIDRDYSFDEKFWSKIESTEDIYLKIRNLNDHSWGSTIMFSKEILGPDGKKIGIWFSYYNTTPVKVDSQTNSVAVYNPYKPGSRYSME